MSGFIARDKQAFEEYALIDAFIALKILWLWRSLIYREIN
jgi:hypothetical protein